MLPTAPDPQTDPQTLTLRTFTILYALRPASQAQAWPGALILNLGLAPTGCAVSLAANIAGAVCLSLEPEPLHLRNAQRTGACDFVVNTLDEALRSIKNELRQHRPLSVALEGSTTQLFGEILARGLAPQLLTGFDSHPAAAARLQSLGALNLSFDASPTTPATLSAPALLANFLATHPWQLHAFPFASATALRAFDIRALALLSSAPPAALEDTLRRQWLLAAPRLFPRDRHRTLWLTPEEHTQLTVSPTTPETSQHQT